MKGESGRYLVIIALFLATAILVNRLEFHSYASGSKNLLDSIPDQVGHWKGNRVPIEEKVYRILETDMVMVSRYRKDKETITLSIVNYPELKVDFHKPEYCNTGKGDVVEKMDVRDLLVNIGGASVPASTNVFRVHRSNGQQDLFYYFYKTGSQLEANYFIMRYKMALQFLVDKKANATLVIISIQDIKDINQSMKTIEGFIYNLAPVLYTHI